MPALGRSQPANDSHVRPRTNYADPERDLLTDWGAPLGAWSKRTSSIWDNRYRTDPPMRHPFPSLYRILEDSFLASA